MRPAGQFDQFGMNLIADIGATNSRCSLLDDQGLATRTERFENRDFTDLASLLQGFVGDAPLDRAAIAVAGPIQGDEVALLNINWRFSQAKLAQSLRVSELRVLNDFEALAYALPRLGPGDCRQIGHGQVEPAMPKAVIGPGSGLGVATAVPVNGGWTAVDGEGGHVTLPALDATEAMIVDAYRDADGHCSAERLLSGPGLTRIYECLARQAGHSDVEVSPATITEKAAGGEAIAVATYQVFFALLGTVAGNLALTVGARGGVYVAGGIVPRVVDAVGDSPFRTRFIGKGRYRNYLDAIPTFVIMTELPAFLGLAAVLGFGS